MFGFNRAYGLILLVWYRLDMVEQWETRPRKKEVPILVTGPVISRVSLDLKSEKDMFGFSPPARRQRMWSGIFPVFSIYVPIVPVSIFGHSVTCSDSEKVFSETI